MRVWTRCTTRFEQHRDLWFSFAPRPNNIHHIHTTCIVTMRPIVCAQSVPYNIVVFVLRARHTPSKTMLFCVFCFADAEVGRRSNELVRRSRQTIQKQLSEIMVFYDMCCPPITQPMVVYDVFCAPTTGHIDVYHAFGTRDSEYLHLHEVSGKGRFAEARRHF